MLRLQIGLLGWWDGWRAWRRIRRHARRARQPADGDMTLAVYIVCVAVLVVGIVGALLLQRLWAGLPPGWRG